MPTWSMAVNRSRRRPRVMRRIVVRHGSGREPGVTGSHPRRDVEPLGHVGRGPRHDLPGGSHVRYPSVIVAGARTPIGRLLGGLKDLSAADLGGVAIKGALEKAGVARRPGRLRDHGPGPPGRRRPDPGPRRPRVAGGIPMSVPSITINKVCLSGLNAIALADQLIRAGEFEIVVAGGMESMTNAPHLLPKSREGFKYGDVDAGRLDGLRRAVRPVHQAGDGRLLTEQINAERVEADPRGAGRVRRRARTSGPPRRGRTASSTTRSSRWRSRSARATRSWSPPTRASAATPPPSRWPSCARRSARTAPSPPAPPRRSPTAPPPSS